MTAYYVYPEYCTQIEHRTDGVYRKVIKIIDATGGLKVITEKKILDYSSTGNPCYEER